MQLQEESAQIALMQEQLRAAGAREQQLQRQLADSQRRQQGERPA
jgi:hypothetical protein